ncbi:MAG: redoxin family protein [Lachnospiraceae bacterium]|nr:redoxin family protein [Lachnospiraceae bacterium]
MKKYIMTFVLTIATSALLLSGCSSKNSTVPDSDSSQNASDNSNELQEFKPPVSFEAVTIDGETISSDILSDAKLTMINVWATYCNPCLKEMPSLGEIAASYAPEDFQILGIISDVTITSDEKTLTFAQELIDKTKANYRHLLLNEDLYYGMLLEVSAVPTTFFINSDKQIVDTIIGAMKKSDWEAKIEELLSKETNK